MRERDRTLTLSGWRFRKGAWRTLAHTGSSRGEQVREAQDPKRAERGLPYRAATEMYGFDTTREHARSARTKGARNRGTTPGLQGCGQRTQGPPIEAPTQSSSRRRSGGPLRAVPSVHGSYVCSPPVQSPIWSPPFGGSPRCADVTSGARAPELPGVPGNDDRICTGEALGSSTQNRATRPAR